MKVWEKCNEVKGTKATKDEIANWAYSNRICPLMFDCGLELDIEKDEDGYPKENGFIATARTICDGGNCGFECLDRYLDSEYKESER